jgi:hypothetical protein
VTDRPGIRAIDAIRGKITPNQMNAAIPDRRTATEQISGVIERVTFHNDDSGFYNPAVMTGANWSSRSSCFLISLVEAGVAQQLLP